MYLVCTSYLQNLLLFTLRLVKALSPRLGPSGPRGRKRRTYANKQSINQSSKILD